MIKYMAMKKRLMLGLAIAIPVVALCFFNSSAVSAHVAQRDGEITGTLHIDPADDPIAGEESSLIFLFDDETNRFRTTMCDCVVTIVNANEKNIKLVSASLPRIGTLPFTFPGKAVYIVSVSGAPKQGATFQPFTLSYDVRVERNTDNNSDQSILSLLQDVIKNFFGEDTSHFVMHHLFHIILFGGAIIVAAIVVIRDRN